MNDSNDEITQSLGPFISGTGFILIGNVVGLLGALIARLGTARTFEPELYGNLVIGLTILNVSTLFAMIGLDEAVARYVPRTENKFEIYFISIIISLPLSILGCIILLANRSRIFSDTLSVQSPEMIIPFVISIPFVVLLQTNLALIRATEDVTGRILIQNILYSGSPAIIVIFAIYHNLTFSILLRLWAISYIIISIFSFIYIHKTTSFIRLGRVIEIPRKDKIVEILSFSWPLMLSSGIWLLASNTDNFFIAYYLSSSMVGIYDSAFTIARQLKVFIWSFGFLFLPMFSKLHSNEDGQSLSNFYEVSTKWMIFSSIPPVIILFFHSDIILSVIFGQEYTAGSTVLIIISTGFLVHVLTGLNGGGLSAIGESRLVMYTSVIAFVPNIILNIILIPRWGIMGAAIATSTTYFFQNVSQYYLLQKEIQIKYNWKEIILTSSATIMTYFLYTRLLTSILRIEINDLPSLITMIISILVIHFISVALFGISDRDYEIYREIRHSKLG